MSRLRNHWSDLCKPSRHVSLDFGIGFIGMLLGATVGHLVHDTGANVYVAFTISVAIAAPFLIVSEERVWRSMFPAGTIFIEEAPR